MDDTNQALYEFTCRPDAVLRTVDRDEAWRTRLAITRFDARIMQSDDVPCRPGVVAKQVP